MARAPSPDGAFFFDCHGAANAAKIIAKGGGMLALAQKRTHFRYISIKL